MLKFEIIPGRRYFVHQSNREEKERRIKFEKALEEKYVQRTMLTDGMMMYTGVKYFKEAES